MVNGEWNGILINRKRRRMLDLVKNIEGNPFEHTLNAWNLS